MLKPTEQASLWRVGAGLLGAPAIPAFVFSLVSPAYDGLSSFADRVWRTFEVVVIIGAYLPTVVLAIPAILILRNRLRPTIINCALGGASVAVLPWALLVMLFRPDEADIGGRATVIHGVPTLFGLIEDLRFLAMIAALGLLGGLAFWVLAILNIRPARAAA